MEKNYSPVLKAQRSFFQVFPVVHPSPHSSPSTPHPTHTHTHTHEEGEKIYAKTTFSNFSSPIKDGILAFQNLFAFTLFIHIKDLFPWFLNLILFRLVAAQQSLISTLCHPYSDFSITTTHAGQ